MSKDEALDNHFWKRSSNVVNTTEAWLSFRMRCSSFSVMTTSRCEKAFSSDYRRISKPLYLSYRITTFPQEEVIGDRQILCVLNKNVEHHGGILVHALVVQCE